MMSEISSCRVLYRMLRMNRLWTKIQALWKSKWCTSTYLVSIAERQMSVCSFHYFYSVRMVRSFFLVLMRESRLPNNNGKSYGAEAMIIIFFIQLCPAFVCIDRYIEMHRGIHLVEKHVRSYYKKNWRKRKQTMVCRSATDMWLSAMKKFKRGNQGSEKG